MGSKNLEVPHLVIYKARDLNIQCISIYFDIKKAFDSVPHHLLLNKPQKFSFNIYFNIHLTSYLDNRTQCVKINHSLSSPLPIKSGVPQSSVLGPLLFLLFINDLPDSVQHSHFFLFGDYSKLFSSSWKAHIENDIAKLYKWFMNNGLQFNPPKCKILFFSFHDINFTLGDQLLPSIEQIDDLGIIVVSQ